LHNDRGFRIVPLRMTALLLGSRKTAISKTKRPLNKASERAFIGV
jgi:hypothetical protein